MNDQMLEIIDLTARMQATTPKEALGKAAALLEEVGWTQNVLMNAAGHLCVIGALHYATLDARVYRETKNAVLQELGLSDASSLATWNNTPGRTVEEVTTMLRNAKRWL